MLTLREKEFVEAARSLGATNARIMAREIAPNLVGPILVYTTLAIPNNILGEAGLSFLGVGVNPPTPSWGQMLSDAAQYVQVDPWYLFMPGLAIFITVLAFNLFGDGLRDALDPEVDPMTRLTTTTCERDGGTAAPTRRAPAHPGSCTAVGHSTERRDESR